MIKTEQQQNCAKKNSQGMDTPMKSESIGIKAEDIKIEVNVGMKKLSIERTLKLDKANKELEITTTMKKTGVKGAKRPRSATVSKKTAKKKEDKV